MCQQCRYMRPVGKSSFGIAQTPVARLQKDVPKGLPYITRRDSLRRVLLGEPIYLSAGCTTNCNPSITIAILPCRGERIGGVQRGVATIPRVPAFLACPSSLPLPS